MDEFKIPILPAPAPERNPNEAIVEKKAAAITLPATLDTKGPTTDAVCPYKEPEWSAALAAKCTQANEYKLEVLKSGQIIDEIKALQTKSFWKFGRLPSNDIEMAHPTISRFHAVLQYRPPMSVTSDGHSNAEPAEESSTAHTANNMEPGWYIYDLGSTHGTFLNKQRIPAKIYVRIKVGHTLRLGASTRCYILQGPSDDEDPESEFSITELRAQRQQQQAEKLAKTLEAQRQAEELEREREKAGISWGMMEDADEETDLTVNPYASTNNEELFLDDPKRTLRGFYEREGLDLVYKCEEMSVGSFVCRVELPLDDSNGKPMYAEVIHKGRKKECVVQCALEACRILDRYGLLRQKNQEPLKRSKVKATNSDEEDEFLDRTGDIERRKKRKEKANADIVLTYDDLLKQELELLAKIEKNQKDIEKYQELQKLQKATKYESNARDLDLDSFMQSLSKNAGKELDKTEIRKLRLEEQQLSEALAKLQHLLELTKPLNLDLNLGTNAQTSQGSRAAKATTTTKMLPMIGKRNQFSKFKVVKAANKKMDGRRINQSEVEEHEDDDVNIDKDISSEACVLKSGDRLKTKHDQNNDELISAQDFASERTAEKSEESNNYPKNKCALNSSELRSIEDDNTSSMKINNVDVDDECTQQEQQHGDTCAKRRRQRIRVRSKRLDIEELAEQESVEKYAKWVPPENQTGDGITDLNEKFGY